MQRTPIWSPRFQSPLFVGLSILSLLLVSPGATEGASTARSAPIVEDDRIECERVQIEKPPAWISSAVLGVDEASVVVVDAVKNMLAVFTDDGRRVGQKSELRGEDFYPVALARVEGGYLLMTVNSGLVKLDERLEVVNRAQPMSLMVQGKERGLGSIYQWAGTGDGEEFVGYGAILDDTVERGYRLAFFRSHGDEPYRADPIKLFREGKHYLLGFPYLAATRDEVFFLEASLRPKIYRATEDEGHEVLLDGMPGRVAVRDRLTVEGKGPQTAEAVFSEIASSRLPAGLFVEPNSPGTLFLLVREPSPKGTDWLMYAIDTESGAVGEPSLLPTHSPHLTIVPGSTAWRIIERGEVGPYYEQEISSMLVIPAEAFKDPSAMPKKCGASRR